MQTLEPELVQFSEIMNKIRMINSLQGVEVSKDQNPMSHYGKQVQ